MLILAALAGLALLHSAYRAQAQPGEPPVAVSALEDEAAIPEGAVRPRANARIVMPRKDDPKQRILGQVVWFNLEKISYIDKEDAQLEVGWDELSPDHLGRFLSSLPDRRESGSVLMAAEVMIDQGIEEAMVERLLGFAERADEDAADRIKALRDKMKNRGAAPGPGPDEGDGGDDGNEPGDGGNDGPGTDGQPNIDNPRAWPELTEEQHAAAVKNLQDGTDKVLEKMGHEMGRTETERFLVYSDMSAKESKYWVGLLDKMYDKLCEVFDLDKDLNIWKGKCLLMFFNKREDFIRYNTAAYGNPASGAAGICYQFGNGDVHISMWRQSQKLELAHTLVHEAVHGFLFRYQSSYHVPNWLNEGLAEYISVALVNGPRYPGRANDARSYVKSRGSLDNFLSARNIIGPHYGLAYDVTAMMVAENRKGYVKMIQGIKEGLSAEESFDQKYGASVDRVLNYYAKTRLKMTDLRLR